jgi:hypothetical protein
MTTFDLAKEWLRYAKSDLYITKRTLQIIDNQCICQSVIMLDN